MIRKVFSATVEPVQRAAEGEPARVRITMSNATDDRYGDTVSHAGWVLENFKANPVILWGHDASQPPVGKAVSVGIVGNALVGEVEFAPTVKGQEIATLVAGGFVRAVSVGFLPIKYAPRNGGGIEFTEQELLECSFVSIPANPNALVDDESKSERAEIVKSFGNSPEEEQHNSPPCAAGADTMPENTAPAAPAEPSITMTKSELQALVSGAVKSAINTTTTDPSATIVNAARSESAPETKAVIAGAPHVRGFNGKPQRKATSQKQVLGACIFAAAQSHKLKANPLDMLELNGHLDVALASEKALTAGTLSSGGVLVPEMAGEMIELLRAASVVLPNMRMVNMDSDKVNMGRQNGSATASYGAEGANLTATTATFDSVILNAKKITAMTVVTNEFIKNASVDAESFAADDLMRAAGLKADLVALQGAGTVYEPKGLVGGVVAAQQAQQTGTTFGNYITDLNRCVSNLETADVPTQGAVWIMSPRTKNGLWGLANAMGVHEFREEMMKSGTLYGYKYFVTSQITTAATAASRVFFYQPSEFLFGYRGGFEVAVGEGYTTDGSTLQNAFVQDSIAIRLIGHHDFALRHNKSGAIIHTVTLA